MRENAARRILVVEDDEGVRRTLEDVLSDSGYSVAFATDGAQAIERMAQFQPDLIVLDLHMPGMDGWEFLEVKAGAQPLASVPVIVLSATNAQGIDDANDRGAPICLSKPFQVDALLAEVERLVAEPARQCAWCGQVRDPSGAFSLRSGRKLRWASHGICPRCKAEEKAGLSQP